MKIFLVFFGIIWFDLNVNAQNTYVPDNNFEQALIVLGYDSGFLNDSVPTAKISGLTSLNVNNKNIADLTGIEGFTGLTSLKCSSNQLKTLDVSNNTALILLHCFFNQITTLDVSKNTALTELICYTNQLTNLDVSNNTALTELFCFSNKLTLLDVSKNTALTELFCSSNQLTHLYINNGENAKMANVEAYDNPNLFCIQVDNPALAANYTNWFKDSWATYNVICAPDSVYVPDDNFEQALIDLGYDSGALNNWVPTANISGLTTIDLNKKNIADLTGIEGFTSLTSLYCNSNKLTTLDVSKNTALTELVCSYNQLTMLDISKNTALIELWSHSNQLTTLDLSKNTALTALFCSYNLLTTIDVSKNTALTVLWSHSNQLTALDVSKNSALTELVCSSNQLTTLDVRKNTALTALYSFSNQLTHLFINNGENANLANVEAHDNPNLFCIQVDDPDSAATYPWKKDIGAAYNVNCAKDSVYVPDDNFEQALIDLGYDSGALNDWVPTANISVLTELIVYNKNIADLTGIEGFTSLTSLYCFSNQLKTIDVSKNTALTVLSCSSNLLTTLDVSKNTALTRLYCESNQLKTIDVSKNTDLTVLYCSSNQLKTLDVSKNTALTELVCYSNLMTTLDVSKNTALTGLFCHSNQLTTLNVSKNTYLTVLWCYSNQLTTLDVSKNTALTELFCYSNQLISLFVNNGQNAILESFEAYDNPNLLCIQVDNPALAATYTNWKKNSESTYSSSCTATAIDNNGLMNILNSLKIYPNPTFGSVNIETSPQNNERFRAEVYSVTGALVYQSNIYESAVTEVDLSNHIDGVYLLKLISGNETTTRKIILKR